MIDNSWTPKHLFYTQEIIFFKEIDMIYLWCNWERDEK